jgi:hypothetical protein
MNTYEMQSILGLQHPYQTYDEFKSSLTQEEMIVSTLEGDQLYAEFDTVVNFGSSNEGKLFDSVKAAAAAPFKLIWKIIQHIFKYLRKAWNWLTGKDKKSEEKTKKSIATLKKLEGTTASDLAKIGSAKIDAELDEQKSKAEQTKEAEIKQAKDRKDRMIKNAKKINKDKSTDSKKDKPTDSKKDKPKEPIKEKANDKKVKVIITEAKKREKSEISDANKKCESSKKEAVSKAKEKKKVVAKEAVKKVQAIENITIEFDITAFIPVYSKSPVKCIVSCYDAMKTLIKPMDQSISTLKSLYKGSNKWMKEIKSLPRDPKATCSILASKDVIHSLMTDDNVDKYNSVIKDNARALSSFGIRLSTEMKKVVIGSEEFIMRKPIILSTEDKKVQLTCDLKDLHKAMDISLNTSKISDVWRKKYSNEFDEVETAVNERLATIDTLLEDIKNKKVNILPNLVPLVESSCKEASQIMKTLLQDITTYTSILIAISKITTEINSELNIKCPPDVDPYDKKFIDWSKQMNSDEPMES